MRLTLCDSSRTLSSKEQSPGSPLSTALRLIWREQLGNFRPLCLVLLDYYLSLNTFDFIPAPRSPPLTKWMNIKIDTAIFSIKRFILSYCYLRQILCFLLLNSCETLALCIQNSNWLFVEWTFSQRFLLTNYLLHWIKFHANMLRSYPLFHAS